MTEMTSETMRVPAQEARPLEFANVFRDHASWLWRVVRRLGVREDDASDVVHELFMDLHRNLGRYDSSRPLRPWLYGFAVRAASDHRRKAYVRRERPTAAPPEHNVAGSPEHELRANQRREFVAQLLERMDDAQRVVLVLVDLEELTVAEVASIVGIPLNTAYSRLRLARESFASLAARAQRRGEMP